MDRYVELYIKTKKHQKPFSVDENIFIKKALSLHKEIHSNVVVIPICSTAIFPEAFVYKEKPYVLLDISYIQYIEHLYKHVILLNHFLTHKMQSDAENQINNIKSDAYHFLSLYNYSDTNKSYNYAKLAESLFQTLPFNLGVDSETALFYELLSLYVIRHEANHNNYSTNYSEQHNNKLKETLKSCMTLVEQGKFTTSDEFLRHFNAENRIFDDKHLLIEIKKLLEEPDSGTLFEELYCDYVSFVEVMHLYYSLDMNTSKENTLLVIHEMIEVIDFLNEHLRRLTANAKELSDISPREIARFYLNKYIRGHVLLSFLNNSCGFDQAANVIASHPYRMVDMFQNMSLLYLYPTVGELLHDEVQLSIDQTDSHIEARKNERSRLIGF